eukprot:276501-Rhodomonas_salina.1
MNSGKESKGERERGRRGEESEEEEKREVESGGRKLHNERTARESRTLEEFIWAEKVRRRGNRVRKRHGLIDGR